MVDAEAKREARVVEVDLSLESLERRVEERLNEKVNFLLERLDTAVQVKNRIYHVHGTWVSSAFSLVSLSSVKLHRYRKSSL